MEDWNSTTHWAVSYTHLDVYKRQGLYAVGKKIPYIHSVFHLFVLGGSVLHTVSVWGILR